MAEELIPGLQEPDVVTKYKMAAEMANRVVTELSSLCVAGAKASELCAKGDEMIEKETGSVFNKNVNGKPVPKGIAFPTCVSVNHVLFHYSPIDETEDAEIAEGDMVKIDLGVQLDGFCAIVAHTVVVGATPENPVEGEKADVMLAAYHACQAAARLIAPGNKTEDVVKVTDEICKDYGVSMVEDVVSYSMTQSEYMDEKSVNFRPSDANKKQFPSVNFEEYEAYAVDVVVSNGDGKSKRSDVKTTVFKHTGQRYQLKSKQARTFHRELTQRFDGMAFTLRSFKDNTMTARLGIKECVEHGVLAPFEVHAEKRGVAAAQFKFTVLLMPNGNLKITGLDIDPACFKTDKKIQNQDIHKILAKSLTSKSKKKKNKKKKPAAAAAAQ